MGTFDVQLCHALTPLVNGSTSSSAHFYGVYYVREDVNGSVKRHCSHNEGRVWRQTTKKRPS